MCLLNLDLRTRELPFGMTVGEEACPGAANGNATDGCGDGYTGPACGRCLDGWALNDRNQCKLCTQESFRDNIGWILLFFRCDHFSVFLVSGHAVVL